MFKRNLTSKSHSASEGQRSAVKHFGDTQCLLAALIAILTLVASIDFAEAVSKPSHFPQQTHAHHKLRGLSAATNPASPLKLAKVARVHDKKLSRGIGSPEISNSLYDSRWSTAQLSAARYGLAATSLPSQGLALFAGGWDQGMLFRLFVFLINTYRCLSLRSSPTAFHWHKLMQLNFRSRSL